MSLFQPIRGMALQQQDSYFALFYNMTREKCAYFCLLETRQTCMSFSYSETKQVWKHTVFSVRLCSFLLITVHLNSFMSVVVSVHFSSFLLITVHLYSFMFISVHFISFLFITVQLYSLMFVSYHFSSFLLITVPLYSVLFFLFISRFVASVIYSIVRPMDRL